MLTLLEASRWAEQRNTAVMAERDWPSGLAAWWELAALAVDSSAYQHLLFTQEFQWIGFERQFFDGDEVDVVGFMWEVRRPAVEDQEEIVCTYGGLEGARAHADDAKGLIAFESFRAYVDRAVEEHRAGGVELTGNSLI
jgi:hypothetical protein